MDGIQLKIQWADHHFRKVQNLFRHWVRSDAYRIIPEHDLETGEVLYRLSEDFCIPDDFALIGGDMFQNLRSALDYLACALVRANGRDPTNQTGFPILENAPSTPEEKRVFARKVEGMTEEAKDLIRRCEPYHGGDDTLWRLHELNRREKHRLLFTVGAYISNWSITQHAAATEMPLDQLERMGRAYISTETWTTLRKLCPLKAGDVLLRDPAGTNVNQNLKIEIQIAINETGVCDCEPLFAVLDASIATVARTVKRFAGMY